MRTEDVVVSDGGEEVIIVGVSGPQGNPGSDADVAEHEVAVTGIHGVGESTVESASAAQAKADAALAAAQVYADMALAAFVGAAPEELDTLIELAAALANDPDFAASVNAAIAARLTEAQADALYRRSDAPIGPADLDYEPATQPDLDAETAARLEAIGWVTAQVGLRALILDDGAGPLVEGVNADEGAPKRWARMAHNSALTALSRDGIEYLVARMGDASNIDAGIYDNIILGDARVKWVSVRSAEGLDLVQGDIIDIHRIGNTIATTDTWLVQGKSPVSGGADYLVGIKTKDAANNYIQRVVVENGRFTNDTRVIVRNAGRKTEAVAGQTIPMDEWMLPSGRAMIVDANGYLVIYKKTAPPNSTLSPAGMALWWEDTLGAPRLRVRAKDANGTFHDQTMTPQASTIGAIIHGANSNVARPAGFAKVEWTGSVNPVNSIDIDTWIVTA